MEVRATGASLKYSDTNNVERCPPARSASWSGLASSTEEKCNNIGESILQRVVRNTSHNLGSMREVASLQRPSFLSQQSDIDVCPICRDEISGLATFVNPDPKCNHKMHPHCVATWMARPTKLMLEGGKDGTEPPTCPTCRAPIDLQKDEFLKAYSEVLAWYENATVNMNANVPYMDEVLLPRLDTLDHEEEQYVNGLGLVTKEFWESELAFPAYKEFLSNLKKSLSHIYDKAPVLLGEYRDLLQSKSISEGHELYSQLDSLFDQCRHGIAICNEVTPPYMLLSTGADSSGGVRHTLERDFNGMEVKARELRDFPNKISECLKSLDLGSLFEFFYHIKTESLHAVHFETSDLPSKNLNEIGSGSKRLRLIGEDKVSEPIFKIKAVDEFPGFDTSEKRPASW